MPYAVATEFAGMAKHSLAVALDVLAQFDVVEGEKIGEHCLTLLKRKQSLILAVQFE